MTPRVAEDASLVWVIAEVGCSAGPAGTEVKRLAFKQFVELREAALAELSDGSSVRLARVAAGKRAEFGDSAVSRVRSALAAAGGDADETQSDARALAVKCNRVGDRWRKFLEAIAMMDCCAYVDWPLKGPRTVRWLLQHIARHGGSPLARHTKWSIEMKVRDDGPVVGEHEVVSEVPEYACCYDQVDASILCMFEVVSRWCQAIEESRKPTVDPGFEGVEHVAARRRLTGGFAFDPALSAYVAVKVKEDVAVLKEQRKAREERGCSTGRAINPRRRNHKWRRGAGCGQPDPRSNPRPMQKSGSVRGPWRAICFPCLCRRGRRGKLASHTWVAAAGSELRAATLWTRVCTRRPLL